MGIDVQTTTYYADYDEKYLAEKPYELKFLPPDNFPVSNITWSARHGIRVTDLRGREKEFSAVKNGFELCHMETSLEYGDFSDAKQVEQIYLEEVAQCMKQVLGADRVLVFDYNIRKSQQSHPLSNGEVLQYETPATVVHIDSTPDWTKHMHSGYCQDRRELEAYSRYQYVNLWKPLKGPVTKWPLMICDWTTYDPKTDVIARDIVYTDDAVETYLAFHNPGHKFYYLNDQRENEAWILVQTDSTHEKGVPHTAFPTPNAPSLAEERESIEVRAMVYYK